MLRRLPQVPLRRGSEELHPSGLAASWCGAVRPHQEEKICGAAGPRNLCHGQAYTTLPPSGTHAPAQAPATSARGSPTAN